MRHVIVTRFSVPRPQAAATAEQHRDPAWLDRRLELLRRFFVPSVKRLHVPVILLCSTQSAPYVGQRVRDLEWAEVVVQDQWYGGWTGEDDHMVTRIDSDDAVDLGWLEAVQTVPADAEVCCTRDFLRFDPSTRRLCAYSRREPSPLAAFRNGRNPFAHDHKELDRHYRVHEIEGPYLLQVFHGGNLSSRRPSWYRRRLPLSRLADFGLETEA